MGCRLRAAGVCVLALLAVLPVAGPGRAAPAAVLSQPAKATLVTIARPDDDPTLIDDAVAGLRRAGAALGGRVGVRWVPLTEAQIRTSSFDVLSPVLLDALAQAGRDSDLVITWGDQATDAVIRLAPRFPRTQFVLIDPIYVDRLPRNVAEAFFNSADFPFLGGAAAALASRNHTIGFIAPIAIQLPRTAYRAGASYVNPHTRILVDYITMALLAERTLRVPPSWAASHNAGSSEPGFHRPEWAEEVALAQYDLGADVVFTQAGASDAGVYRAAVRRNRWVIATGGPTTLERLPAEWRSHVLAMMIIRPDRAVSDIVTGFLAHRALGLAFPPHIGWALEAPLFKIAAPSADALGFTVNEAVADQLGARTVLDLVPWLAAQLRRRQFGIPYNEAQFAEFLKDVPAAAGPPPPAPPVPKALTETALPLSGFMPAWHAAVLPHDGIVDIRTPDRPLGLAAALALPRRWSSAYAGDAATLRLRMAVQRGPIAYGVLTQDGARFTTRLPLYAGPGRLNVAISIPRLGEPGQIVFQNSDTSGEKSVRVESATLTVRRGRPVNASQAAVVAVTLPLSGFAAVSSGSAELTEQAGLLRIHTTARPEAYAAELALPSDWRQSYGDAAARLRIRLTVEHGPVGVAVLKPGAAGTVIAERTLAAGTAAADVTFDVPRLEDAGAILIRNLGTPGAKSVAVQSVVLEVQVSQHGVR